MKNFLTCCGFSAFFAAQELLYYFSIPNLQELSGFCHIIYNITVIHMLFPVCLKMCFWSYSFEQCNEYIMFLNGELLNLENLWGDIWSLKLLRTTALQL